MSTAATALAMLRESRDGQPARVWHDNGRTVGRLARTAGVVVTYALVDLAAGETTYRTVDGRQQEEEGE